MWSSCQRNLYLLGVPCGSCRQTIKPWVSTLLLVLVLSPHRGPFYVQGSPVNRLNILARHASSGLLIDTSNSLSPLSPTTDVASLSSHSSVKERVHEYILSRISFLRFRTALFAIDVAFHLTNWTAWLSLTRRRLTERIWGRQTERNARSGKFEDALEDRLREMGTHSITDLMA